MDPFFLYFAIPALLATAVLMLLYGRKLIRKIDEQCSPFWENSREWNRFLVFSCRALFLGSLIVIYFCTGLVVFCVVSLGWQVDWKTLGVGFAILLGVYPFCAHIQWEAGGRDEFIIKMYSQPRIALILFGLAGLACFFFPYT